MYKSVITVRIKWNVRKCVIIVYVSYMFVEEKSFFIVLPTPNLAHSPSEIIKLEKRRKKRKRERMRNVIFHIKWCLSTHGNDVSHAEQTRQKFLIINIERNVLLKNLLLNKYIAGKILLRQEIRGIQWSLSAHLQPWNLWKMWKEQGARKRQ